jgi:AcrR family transcriptional regulator
MALDGTRAPRMAPEERRAAIVAATTPLVLRHGSDVTTRQIAEAAGVAEGTIFRVFADKESVLRAVLTESLNPDLTLRDLAEVDRNLPFRERLTAVVTVIQRRFAEVFGLLAALGLPGPPERRDDPVVRRRLQDAPNPKEINEAFHRAVADVIGPDAHRLRMPATQFAHVMRLFAFSATHPLISGGHPLSVDEIVSVLLDGALDPPTTSEDLAC